MPVLADNDPIQLDLAEGDFQKLHGAFAGRPVAQLFLVVSLWTAGRLQEVAPAEWDWVAGDLSIDIPDPIAKRGKGRVVRIPSSIMAALKAQRVVGSPSIFRGFTEEYRRLSKRHAGRILANNPGTYDLICKRIKKKADGVGLNGVTHHSLRSSRTRGLGSGTLFLNLHIAWYRKSNPVRSAWRSRRPNWMTSWNASGR